MRKFLKGCHLVFYTTVNLPYSFSNISSTGFPFKTSISKALRIFPTNFITKWLLKSLQKFQKARFFGIILVFCVLLTLAGCASTSTFDGSRVKNADSYQLDIKTMNCTDTHTLELKQGDTLKIQFETENGNTTRVIQSFTKYVRMLSEYMRCITSIEFSYVHTIEIRNKCRVLPR